MSKCFEPGTINGLSLANRFVRSATWEGMATSDGAATPKLQEAYAALVEGEVGLIVTGHAYVAKPGQAAPWQLGVDTDERIPGLAKLTATVHDRGGKIVLQLAHAGTFASAKLTGGPPWAASALEGPDASPRREMSGGDIRALTTCFAEAAARAREAGFDGVQLHCAHGYLLSQFLSPLYNRRADEYGGGIENRARFPVGVVRAIRAAVGADYPVLAKLNGDDFVEGGLNAADALRAGGMLADAGLDAIETSGGPADRSPPGAQPDGEKRNPGSLFSERSRGVSAGTGHSGDSGRRPAIVRDRGKDCWKAERRISSPCAARSSASPGW